MKRALLLAAIGLSGLSVVAIAAVRGASAANVPDPSPSLPALALLATEPRGDTTTLYRARPGETPVPLVSFVHRKDAVVRGATIPGRDVVVAVADTTSERDRSWSGGLHRLEAGTTPALLVTGVAYASRPLVAGSHVLVARGIAGEVERGEDGKAKLRVDAISIDDVDPDTGATSTLFSANGYLALPVAFHAGELIGYVVDEHGAALVGIAPKTGNVRPVVPSMPPTARDFSLDAARGALVFQKIVPGASPRTIAVRVDLASGAETEIAATDRGDLVPFATESGDVLFAARGRLPSFVGASPPLALDDPEASLWVRASTTGWLGALVLRDHELPRPVLVRTSDGAVVPVPRLEARVEIAGFVGGAP